MADKIKHKSCQSVKQKTQDFFISEKTSKLIREKRKARRLAMRFSDEPEYMTMYKSLTNEVKESIKTDKERAWQEQIDKLDGARDGTEFWNSIFRLTGAKSRGTRKTPLMRSDGTHTENDKERADTFAASLEKVHNVHQGTIFDDEFKVEVESTIKEHEMLFKPLVSHVPEDALKLIEAWCSKWRIKLNAGKTQLIVFSVGPKPELIDLELFGEPIIQTQTAKLLGILFDRRLSFKDHMEDLMTKVYRRLNLLKLLKGTNWGARPYTILKAYKCFIRPVLEYGSLITGALRESQVKEMQIFQNKCLRLALGVTYLDRMRTIDLHDLTNVPMIKTRMTALAVKTFRSLENTQCFKDLVLNHEIVQKRSGSNTILD